MRRIRCCPSSHTTERFNDILVIQVRGFTYVFDEKGVSWSQLSIWSPSEVSKAFSCCERALPMRHRSINFLNLPWTMSLIFQFAKSLLSEKIRSRFQTHSSLDSLCGEVEASVLPQEYGGTRPLSECISLWERELGEARNSLLDLDTMKIQPQEHQGLQRKKSKPDCDSGTMKIQPWEHQGLQRKKSKPDIDSGSLARERSRS